MAIENDVDPYASAKSNIRETIKWLAASFSALAAVILGGTPISGLGRLRVDFSFLLGALSLLIAFVCVCAALRVTIRLLRSDALYLSDLGVSSDGTQSEESRPDTSSADRREIQAVQEDIKRRAFDILPPEFPDLDDLIKLAKEGREEVQRLAKEWGTAQGTAEQADVSRDLATARENLASLIPALTRALTYGSYIRLYTRLNKAMPALFAFGVVALISLAAFGVIVSTADKTPEGKTVIIEAMRR